MADDMREWQNLLSHFLGRTGPVQSFFVEGTRAWEAVAARRLTAFRLGLAEARPWVAVQKLLIEMLGIEPPVQFLSAAVEDVVHHPVSLPGRSVDSVPSVETIATTLVRVAADPEMEVPSVDGVHQVSLDGSCDEFLFYDWDERVLTVLAIARKGSIAPRDRSCVEPVPGSVTPSSQALIASVEMGRLRRDAREA